MQVSVETTQGLGRRVKITIPNTDIEKAVSSEMVALSKKVCIDGFRKGKAPIKIIKQHYGTSVLQHVLKDIMQHHFIREINKQNISLAGTPRYHITQFQEGKDFTYIVEYEIYPNIHVKEIESITVEKLIISIQDKDIDVLIATLQKQKSTLQETNEKACIDSRVTIDYKGTVDGFSFAESNTEDFVLVIGEGNMMPGFEEGIIGHQAGEKFTIDITIPVDYHEEHLKGQSVKFAINLKKVEQHVLPKLTEEFIKHLGVADGSIESLRAEVRKNIDREVQIVVRNHMKVQVLNGLIKKNNIEVPTSAIESEIHALRRKTAQRLGKTAKTALELPNELFKNQAKQRVIISLILYTFINQYSVTADDVRVQSLLEEITAAYENPSKVIKYYRKDKELMDSVRNLAIEDQVVEILLKKMKVINKTIQFQELITQGKLK